MHRHDRDERGRLEHADRFVARRRDDDSHGLRKDDPPHRLHPGETESARGLLLSVVDREDSRADDLGHVCRLVESQPEDRRHRRRDQLVGVERDPRQPESDHGIQGCEVVPEEQLDEDRRASEGRDVGPRGPADDRVGRQPHDREQRAEDDADHHARHGQTERHHEPAADGDVPQVGVDRVPTEPLIAQDGDSHPDHDDEDHRRGQPPPRVTLRDDGQLLGRRQHRHGTHLMISPIFAWVANWVGRPHLAMIAARVPFLSRALRAAPIGAASGESLGTATATLVGL